MKTLKAYSKLNLFLEVTGKRPNGYHELYSLCAFLDLADEIHVEEAAGISVQGGIADNIILKAAFALAKHFDVRQGAQISFTKNIPFGGGLGGGSADAAATLLLLNDLWDLSASNTELYEIGLRLGADVPVCLYSHLENTNTAFFRGIGEILSPAPAMAEMHFLLVHPNTPLATAEVFKYFRYEGSVYKPYGGEGLEKRRNDLQAVSRKLMPEVDEILKEIAATKNCQLARMTGSGATCFGVYETAGDANNAAEQIAMLKPGWWVKTAQLKN